MRVDKCFGIIVGLLLTISTVTLLHGMYTASTISHARRDEVSYFGGWINKMRLSSSSSSSSSSSVKKKHVEESSSLLSDPPHLDKNKPLCPPKSPGTFWGDNMKKKKNQQQQSGEKVGWCRQRADQCTEEYFDSLPTYDDFIAAGFSRDKRHEMVDLSLLPQEQDLSSEKEENSAFFCDPFSAPFVGNKNQKQQQLEARCLAAMRDESLWESVDMIQPKFEQRTVKYVVTLKSSSSKSSSPIRLLMKVPQSSFATEPFSEITAFELDRALHVNRIPPTVLVPFPLQRLHDAALRVMSSFKMVEGLGYSEKNFSKWWQSEFYRFVQRSQSPRVMVNGTHLWVSMQLRLEGVTELLSSPLRVPYSKKHSGWHRWFNPRWEGFSAVTNTSVVAHGTDAPQAGYEGFGAKPYSELLHASMMALSELAIFDFLMLNNDRSPNKNNFIVEGCYTKRKWKRLEDSSSSAVVMENQKQREVYCSKSQLSYRSSSGGKKGAGADDLEKKEKQQQHRHHSSSSSSSASGGGGTTKSDKFKGRVERHFPMTFVHLDQGMAFHGFSFVNNPVEKKVNNTFCMFYRPLMERVRCFLAERAESPTRAEEWLKRRVPEAAQRIIGRKKVKWIVGQLSRLVEKRDRCLEMYGEEIVMQPSHFPRD